MYYAYQIIPTISLQWQPVSVVIKFDWRHSIPLPWEPTVRCYALGDISHTSQVIANCVWNFVSMATGDGRGEFVWHHSI